MKYFLITIVYINQDINHFYRKFVEALNIDDAYNSVEYCGGKIISICEISQNLYNYHKYDS